MPTRTITPSDKRTLRDQFFRRPSTLRCLDKLGGYAPECRDLFLQAFTHSSFVHQHPHLKLANYQRLEFLGDAAINLYVTDKICTLFPDMREGELSPLRSSLVCGKSLTSLGKFLGLDKMILMGKGATRSPTLVEDVFEALVGSIYKDRGFIRTCQMLEELLKAYQKKIGRDLFHPRQGRDFDKKSHLQEITLKLYGKTPEYRSEKMDENRFRVNLWIAGRHLGSALAPSKREAEKALAEKALNEKLYQNILPSQQ